MGAVFAVLATVAPALALGSAAGAVDVVVGVVGIVGVGGAGGVALTPLANAVRTNMVWRITSGKVRLTRKLLESRSGSRLTPAHSVTASVRRSRGALVQRCSPAGVIP